MIKNSIVYNYKWQFTIKKAKGCYFWDQNDRKILDFSSGWNVANLGWNHPEIAKAMINQIKRNVYVPMEMGEEIQYKYAKKLLQSLPESFNVVSRSTGGTEANEQAIKIARAATGRKKIVGFYDAYHGESLGDLSIGYRKEYISKISPLVPQFVHLDYPAISLSQMSEKVILADFLQVLDDTLKKEDVAAVVTEPGMITGWGSAHLAPKGFLSGIRSITKNYGTLLILDEVGTGFSRTGKLFGMNHEDVVPDIATFAKGMSNGGAAIGALATSKDLIDSTEGETHLISTFGWTPVACAAAYATLNVHLREKIWEQSANKGQWLKTKLKEMLGGHPKVGDIRGMGMEIGLMFVNDRKQLKPDMKFAQLVANISLNKNLYLSIGDEGTLQLMPPLIASIDELDEGLNIITKSVKQAYNEQ